MRTLRNNSLFDAWSLVHIIASAALAVIFGPLPAMLIATIWEPIELFVVSPLADHYGWLFGHEGWKNSLSDIAFNGLGVLLAIFLFIET